MIAVTERVPDLNPGDIMSVTMREMLEAGVHFGHQTRFWNPKMAPFIFGHRNRIHIVNLEKTMGMYQEAMKYIRQLSSNRGTVLFLAPNVKHVKPSQLKRNALACLTLINAGWVAC